MEFQKGDFLYRDIFFSMTYFIGQETVYYKYKPVWSMAYSGGTKNIKEIQWVKDIYTFLRKAMRSITHENPFRGPKEFNDEELSYKNTSSGDLNQFAGEEWISLKDEAVYSLKYSGGYIK